MFLTRVALLVLTTAMLATPAMAECDLDAGEKVFKKCKTCHQVGEGAENKLGPALNGIVDAVVASNADYAYSDALLEKKAEGLVWNAEELSAYLEKPKKHTPGTKMSFAGLRKEDERTNVICYLATFE